MEIKNCLPTEEGQAWGWALN